MSISGMEYQIDPEDDKKVQVQTVDNELVLIISQGDCKIFMEAEMYDELKKHLDELSLALVRICLNKSQVDYTVPLGGGLYAYAKSPFRCVQIRHFVERDAVLLPSKQGISLKRKQWSTLIDIFKCIEEEQATPKKSTKCTELHQNQEDYFSCPLCSPTLPDTPKKKKKSTSEDSLRKRLSLLESVQ